MDEHTPEYYDIIPEYNSAGRLCNYGSGREPTVRVPAAEWERFNRLTGRRHRVIDGIVVYDETLELCMPDEMRDAEVQQLIDELSATDYRAIKYAEGWYTEEEYEPYRVQRQVLRDRINALSTHNKEGTP